MTRIHNWQTWMTLDDVPQDIRQSLKLAELVGEMAPGQFASLEESVVRAAKRAVQDAIERERIYWACRALCRRHGDLPKRGVFRVVGLHLGKSENRVRELYYGEEPGKADQ